jgi:hypothetical protein
MCVCGMYVCMYVGLPWIVLGMSQLNFSVEKAMVA